MEQGEDIMDDIPEEANKATTEESEEAEVPHQPKPLLRRPSERKVSDIRIVDARVIGDEEGKVFPNTEDVNVKRDYMIKRINPSLTKNAMMMMSSNVDFVAGKNRLRKVTPRDENATKQVITTNENVNTIKQIQLKPVNTNLSHEISQNPQKDQVEHRQKKTPKQDQNKSVLQPDKKSKTLSKDNTTETPDGTKNDELDRVTGNTECNNSLYATISEIKKKKRPPAPMPKKRTKPAPAIIVPESILESKELITPEDDYAFMIPKVPLPLPPRDDLSNSNIPTNIETNFKGLASRYEAFLSHIYHDTSNPFDSNFKQGHFSAGIFKEDGGILTVNGAHLTIPNGALQKPTVLFIYRVNKDPDDTRQVGGVCIQYQVSPVIVVGPVTELQQSIFLTIDLYMVDGSEWTYEPKVRRSNDTSWEPLKSKSISIKQETRWIHTLQILNHVMDFKLNGSPKRKNISDSDGPYDVPIKHFMTVKMGAVIENVKSDELSITVKKADTDDSKNADECTEKTILLNQLGGEFLIMNVFGIEERIHIGNIICGHQTFTKLSFKVPSTVYRNASIKCRQELKEDSFELNITLKDSHALSGTLHWQKDLRTFSALLSKYRFNMITEFGQCEHWVQFCRLAFDFSEAQANHFRTLPYFKSFAINLYTAINDTCGNTLELLTPLQKFLEDADILQASSVVKEEIEESLSLCDKRSTAEFSHNDSGSEDEEVFDNKHDEIG
ncbi:uncharacterized protein [Antedon mediterranea]|uniref:uncharacterized protein n=1 Tax=Antedon mediterranea TaxID=105859 RepID=UPI003AF4F60A